MRTLLGPFAIATTMLSAMTVERTNAILEALNDAVFGNGGGDEDSEDDKEEIGF